VSKQIFGSALRQPWGLMVHSSTAPEGRRPATSVVYLTDDEGDYYLGGEVMHWRSLGDTRARWHYRYKHAKHIPKTAVLHVFASMSKSPYKGPTPTEIRQVKKTLPVTQRSNDHAN
jgi:hypothetical protein